MTAECIGFLVFHGSVGAIRHRRDGKSPNVKIGLRVVLTGRRRQRAERTKLLLDCLVTARSDAMISFNKNFSCWDFPHLDLVRTLIVAPCHLCLDLIRLKLLLTNLIPALPDKDESGNVIEDEFSDLPFPSQHIARFPELCQFIPLEL